MIVLTDSFDKGGVSSVWSSGGGGGEASGPIRVSNKSFGETADPPCTSGFGGWCGLDESGYPEEMEAGEGATDSDLLLLEDGVSTTLSTGSPRDSRSSSGFRKRRPHMNKGFETSPALKMPGRPGIVDGGGSSSGQNLYMQPVERGLLADDDEGAGYLGGDGFSGYGS